MTLGPDTQSCFRGEVGGNPLIPAAWAQSLSPLLTLLGWVLSWPQCREPGTLQGSSGKRHWRQPLLCSVCCPSGDPTRQPCALRPQDTNLSGASPCGWEGGQARTPMVLTTHRISPCSSARPVGQASKPPRGPLPWHPCSSPTAHLPSNFMQL